MLAMQSNTSEGSETESADMRAAMAEIHAFSSGAKCWSGFWAASCLEDVRRCMGGYGYSLYSNIHSLTSDFQVNTQGRRRVV